MKPEQLHVTIRTYAEGVLAPLAHDLELTIRARLLEQHGDVWVAEFHAEDMRVVGAVKRGRVDPSILSEKDKREIERRIVEEHLRGTVQVRLEGDRVDIETPRGKAAFVAKRTERELDVTLSLKALGLGTIKGPLGVFRLRDAVQVRAATSELSA